MAITPEDPATGRLLAAESQVIQRMLSRIVDELAKLDPTVRDRLGAAPHDPAEANGRADLEYQIKHENALHRRLAGLPYQPVDRYP